MYYYGKGQMDLSDRIAIEVGINRRDSFKKIAELLGRHPSTIANEIKTNRTFLRGEYYRGIDCRYARKCKETRVCGKPFCSTICVKCRLDDCREHCSKYVSMTCKEHYSPPYVCNKCSQRRVCHKERYIYSAKYADAFVKRRRSESRMGLRLNKNELEELDRLVTALVRKGQPLTHIYANHEKDMPICLRSLYNYIDSGKMTVRNIDLRRKTSYKPRKKGKARSLEFWKRSFRENRSYGDFLQNITAIENDDVVEMDTVKGVREREKRLLTMIFRKNSIMLLFLLPDGTAQSVIDVFNYLEASLGLLAFHELFPIILTDNGSEFMKVDRLELNEELISRTTVYYCDPMASWQKPHIEKNHHYIRYAIPSGKSLNPYTDEDITLLMNHINSVKRPSLGNRSPYELVEEDDVEMHELMRLLKMHPIAPDEVHLLPDLFIKK
jgi:IS30 family transposase